MPSREPYNHKKSKTDFERELCGKFRVDHHDEPQPESTQESPEVCSMRYFKPRPPDWLWKDKIPLGKLTLIEGPPGVGKLYAALDIVARVSTAKPWPDDAGVPSSGGSIEVAAAGMPGEPAEAGTTNSAAVGGEVVAGAQAQVDPPRPGRRRGWPYNEAPELPDVLPPMPVSERTDPEFLYDLDPPLRRYVPPADYVPPPVGLTPSSCVPPGAPRVATPVVVVCNRFEAEDMIRPRLERLGADLDNVDTFVHSWTASAVGLHPRGRPIDFPLDLMMFDYIIRDHRGCRMIVIDNLDNYCATPRQLREAIRLLDQKAIFYNVAIVATIQGNVKVAPDGTLRDTARKTDGLARSIWCVTHDPSHPGLMRFEPKRLTFCKKPQGIAFRINDAGEVIWEPLPAYQKPLTEAARRRKSEHERLVDWLRDQLADGVVPAGDIYDEGEEEGFTKNKLRAARHEIGARKVKSGFDSDGCWLWTLMPVSEASDDEVRAAYAGEPGTSVPGSPEADSSDEEQEGVNEDGGSGMEDREEASGGRESPGGATPGPRSHRKDENLKNFEHLRRKRRETKGFEWSLAGGKNRRPSELTDDLIRDLARRVLREEQIFSGKPAPKRRRHAGNGNSDKGHHGNGQSENGHAENQSP